MIYASGDITANFSDGRLKENIEIIENCLDKIQRLSGIIYVQNKLAEKYGFNDYKPKAGLIAQQIQPFAPEILSIAPFDMDEEGKSRTGENYLTVKYERLIPIVIEAIKEQQKEIQILLSKLQGLK
jgi:hypothetical protein